MPIYEYRCEDGHEFEVMQRIADEPVQSCEVCGVAVHRVFRPPAVHFKGSGFYNTDYGTRKRQREKQESSKESASSNGSSSNADSSSDAGAKKADSSSTSSTTTTTTSSPAKSD